jgi:hypothetical protein
VTAGVIFWATLHAASSTGALRSPQAVVSAGTPFWLGMIVGRPGIRHYFSKAIVRHRASYARTAGQPRKLLTPAAACTPAAGLHCVFSLMLNMRVRAY